MSGSRCVWQKNGTAPFPSMPSFLNRISIQFNSQSICSLWWAAMTRERLAGRWPVSWMVWTSNSHRSSVPSANRASERAEETPATTPENKPQLDSMSRDLLKICTNNWSEERTSLPERTWVTAVGILIESTDVFSAPLTTSTVISIQPNQPHQRNTSATRALRHATVNNKLDNPLSLKARTHLKITLNYKTSITWNSVNRICSDYGLTACWTIWTLAIKWHIGWENDEKKLCLL